MPKRPRRTPSAQSTPPASPRRDPLTRLTRFNQILALGLVGASLYLPFGNALDRPGLPPVTLDLFDGLLLKSAIVAVHTRTPWVILAVAGLIIAVMGHRSRHHPAPSRRVRFSPLIILLVVALQSAAQGYLQSQSPLHVEIRTTAPLALNLGTLPGDSNATLPAVQATAISRLTLPEGTSQQWISLFASDLMYSVPILLACMLAFAPKSPQAPHASAPGAARPG